MPPIRRASYYLHLVSTLGYRPDPAQPTFLARLALIGALDMALDLTERDTRFASLTLDGGVAPLEDYLAARPEHFERVERAVSTGRLWIGAWYVPPDLTACGPEALIRNLLLGRAAAAAFGRCSPVVYLPDADRLPAALPQLLREFGISAVIAAHDGPPEARWRGMDGSEIVLLRPAQADSLIGARAACAPYACSGHILAVRPFAPAPDPAPLWADIAAARASRQDEAFHSSLTDYAKAVSAYAARPNAELPTLTGEIGDFQQYGGRLFESEQHLCGLIEPAAVLDSYGVGVGLFPPRPATLIRGLWAGVLRAGAAVPEAQADAVIRLSQTRRVAEAIAAAYGVPQGETLLERVVRADTPAFRVTAAKVPDDGREGLIVRGVWVGADSGMVTLTPFRAFGEVHVVRADESETGGSMGVLAGGAIRFRAVAGRYLTVWFR